MSIYYVSDSNQFNGTHEVHKSDCYWLAFVTSKTKLGEYSTCNAAMIEAKKLYPNSNGCEICICECHKIEHPKT